MKQSFYTILLTIALSINVQAQVIVDFMNFPLAGDTLFISTDNLPTDIRITSGGANQTWDFSSLQAPFVQEMVYKVASEGKDADAFPNAQLVVKNPNGTEIYYSLDNNIFELEGYAGPDPAGLGVELVVNIKPSLIERRSPMKYLAINSSTSEAMTPFSAERLPTKVINQLPITPDSLRIRIKSTREDFVDAWGKLTLPNGTFDVLREKRVEYSDRRLDVQLGFFPWQDVTDLLAGTIPDFFAVDTTISYHYFSPMIKEPIAVVSLNADESVIKRVQFKNTKTSTNNTRTPAINGKSDVIAYPNPAIENARFSFSNLKRGTYSLKIFNILGVVIWEEEYDITGSKTVNIDFSDFRKGTYLYSLSNEQGKTLVTKRLLIIRP